MSKLTIFNPVFQLPHSALVATSVVGKHILSVPISKVSFTSWLVFKLKFNIGGEGKITFKTRINRKPHLWQVHTDICDYVAILYSGLFWIMTCQATIQSRSVSEQHWKTDLQSSDDQSLLHLLACAHCSRGGEGKD